MPYRLPASSGLRVQWMPEVAYMLIYYEKMMQFKNRQSKLLDALSPDCKAQLRSFKYSTGLLKLSLLNTDLVESFMRKLYSSTGRPAHSPTVYLRSFTLMLHLGFTSVDTWVDEARASPLLRAMLGIERVPSVSSHYDFINRLSGEDIHLTDLYPKGMMSGEKLKELKEKYKQKKGEKLVNFDGSVSDAWIDEYSDKSKTYKDPDFCILQELFNMMAVIPSIDKMIIPANPTVLSGDGTALHIHCSPFGHRAVAKTEDETADSKTYRYGSTSATFGWDSFLEMWYYGHVLHNTTYHSDVFNVDLPVFLTLAPASQHDLLTSISSIAEMLSMNPSLKPKYMCYDSASDSTTFYKYVWDKEIVPIIDLNKHGKDKVDFQCSPKASEKIDADGTPICANGCRMCRDGYDKGRKRTKYRCPLKKGKIDSCEHTEGCSDSEYGRVVHVQDDWNLRLYGPVQRDSKEWKEIYRNRTSTERVNNRILNDYHLQDTGFKSQGKLMFWAVIAGIELHLDAWSKIENQDLVS